VPNATTIDRARPWLIVLSMLLTAVLAATLYGRAARFAYFNDDPSGHFAWMEGQSTADFFRSSADYGYYRPVVFATLRATETLAGGHNPAVDHTLLLLLHAANAALVWLLAYRLSRGQPAYAWVAALVFIAFPFNYEAVTYVASLTHPLLLFWLLLTLHLYIWGRTAGRRVPLLLAGLTLVLGLLTHENGLMTVPALAGVEWVLFRPPTWRAWLRPWWPYAVPALLYIPLWLLIPKESAATLSLAATSSNAVPFLQSLVYPLLPLLRLEASETGLLDLTALLFLSATSALAWRAGARRLWLFAAGWLVLSALPALLFLSPDYLYGSPRLSYVFSVGVGLLWGLPVLWLWRAPALVARRGPVWTAGRWVLTAGLALAIVVPPLSFLRCQMDFYDEASDIARGLAAAAAEAPPGEPLTFVNLPFFFSSTTAHPDGCPSPYPWTPVGAVVVPPYAQVRDFVRFNGGPDRPVSAVAYPGYAPGWRTVGEAVDDDALRALAGSGRVLAFDLLTGTYGDVSAAWQPGAATDRPALVAFGAVLDLVEARLENQDTQLVVDLTWRVTRQPPGQPAAFVHVYGPDGALLAQSDAPPGRGLAPVALWRPGDVLTDRAVLPLDVAALPPGTTSVRVGVYDPLTGERLPAMVDGRPVPDGAVEIGRIDKE
jgi:hypothetical protein